ncbi:MAG: 4-hydroxybenzoate octaprenyltransferase [Nitrospirae bacterium]|nr:4-hydroxybenzoate octaprenyltransferase [Nitrospirota bacterium]
MSAKGDAIFDLIRLDKQYGTVLLMMPTLWSLVLASRGKPSALMLVIFVLGTFVMRSAGCVVNDILDRDIDRDVERTKNRPVASGRLTVREAFGVLAVLLGVALVLVLMLNPLCRILSLVALLLMALYPLMKRYIQGPQFFLGAAFGWGAIMAWAAVWEKVELPAILIFLATLFWAAGYDTLYAMMDREDDLRIGVKSTAILFGKHIGMAVAILFLLTILLLAVVGWKTRLGYPFHVAIGIATVYFLYQSLRISGEGVEREVLFGLFKAHCWVGAIILTGLEVDLLMGGTYAV